MTASEVLDQLSKMGDENIRKIFKSHGAPDPIYGVRVGDLKTIQKKIKKNHPLAMELYKTGVSDAMYLAGLIGDGSQMSHQDLNEWAKNATWNMISEYTVPWVASDNEQSMELALEWIRSEDSQIAGTGWATISCIASIRDDQHLDIPLLSKLLDDVGKTIHSEPNRVRYNMNGFVIAMGSFVAPLYEQAREIAAAIGKVKVNLGDTSCKVPLALEYIEKVNKMGRTGKKRKEARC